MPDTHAITSWTRSVIAINGKTRDPSVDINDPEAEIFVVVDYDKFNLEQKKPPRIKMPGGSVDHKAPVELGLNALAQGCNIPEPFPGMENRWAFPSGKLSDAAAEVSVCDRITAADIARAAAGVTAWRNGGVPSPETLALVAASETGEEGGILILWTDLVQVLSIHGNDRNNPRRVHDHSWFLASPLTTNHALHPEILCNGWVKIADLEEVLAFESDEKNPIAWISECSGLKRIKDALWSSDAKVRAIIEEINGVVSTHADAFRAAQQGARDAISCRTRTSRCTQV